MLLTFKVDVLAVGKDNIFPRGGSKEPGVFFLVRNDDGLNDTVDAVGFSVGLENAVLDYEGIVCVTEEGDMVCLEDEGHGRW